VLLKFAYQDLLDGRRFKNTTKTNIKNNEMLWGQKCKIVMKKKDYKTKIYKYIPSRIFILYFKAGRCKYDKKGIDTKNRGIINECVTCNTN